jgi:CubicO group peptidase (beta-lactamase class C family)
MKKKYLSIITLASIVIGVTGYRGQSSNKPTARKIITQEPEMTGWTFTPQEILLLHKEYTVNELYGVNNNTRYVYLHLNEFMQTATVFRKGPVSGLALSLMPQLSAVKAKSDLGELTLDEYLQKSEVQGIIVLHHGKIVYERYPRMSEMDKHIYFSLSKPLVATAIALLEDDGAINSQDPVGKYLPELYKSDWGKVRILDILNMSSGMTGLQFDDPEALTDSNNIYFRFASCMGIALKTESVDSSIWDIFNKMRRQKEPGTAFEYSSTNTVILSLLVEKVTGKRFSDFISDRIWKKLGAEADGYIGLSPQGIASTSATMNSTLRDLARFGLLFTPSWHVVSKEKLISDSYLQKIQAGGGKRSAYDKGVMGKQIIGELGEIPDHNSYQWDAIMADGDFFKSGTNGQGLYISRSRDLVIACFAHSNHFGKAYLRAIATSGLFALNN